MYNEDYTMNPDHLRSDTAQRDEHCRGCGYPFDTHDKCLADGHGAVYCSLKCSAPVRSYGIAEAANLPPANRDKIFGGPIYNGPES